MSSLSSLRALSADRDRSAFQLDVTPLKLQQFAPPKTCVERDQHQRRHVVCIYSVFWPRRVAAIAPPGVGRYPAGASRVVSIGERLPEPPFFVGGEMPDDGVVVNRGVLH